MENVIIKSDSIAMLELSVARDNLFEGFGKIGTVITAYATALCYAFDTTDEETGERVTPWYELVGALKKPIKEERARFVAGLEALGYKKGTIDVNWQRVKEASGYQTAGNRAKSNQSADEKNLSDLRTIINRVLKSEEDGADTKWSEVKGDLIEAFEAMGGEVDNLG